MTRRDALRRAGALGVSAAAVSAMGTSAAAQGTPAAEGSPVASSYEPHGPQVEKLVVWTRSSVDTSPNEWRGLTDATARYTELVGTPVELVTVPDADFRTKLSQASPGGDGPDVFGPVAHDWIGEVALQKIALPWEDGDIHGFDDIQQNAVDAVIVDGQVYGYPVFSETLALYRNTDIVAEAPTTWDELVTAATENTEGDQYGFAFNLLAQYYQGAFFHGFGSYIFKREEGTLNVEDIGLNNEGGVEAARFLRDMYNNQQPPMPEAVLDQANAGTFLDGLEESGLLAMAIGGPWRELPLSDAGINYEISNLPTLPNGEPLQPFSGIQVFEVNAYGEFVDAAKDLVNFLGNTEGVQLLMAGYNKPPVRPSLRDAAIALNPNLGMWMDAFEQGVPMPNIPQMAQVWTPWGDAMVGIITNNVSDEEVQSLLDTAVEQIKANIQQ
jgi:arabinogalactan oligomer / maltooligosaccharide transport system substrate-binding protein